MLKLTLFYTLIYKYATYQNALKNKGITQSISRKGNCLDNAVMENFFGYSQIRNAIFAKVLFNQTL